MAEVMEEALLFSIASALLQNRAFRVSTVHREGKAFAGFRSHGGNIVFLCTTCGTASSRENDWPCACDELDPDTAACTTPERCTANNHAKCRAEPCGWIPPF